MIYGGIVLFILGLVVGSFLNALVYRTQKKLSMRGRSLCPECKKKIAWYDLFPVLSWVLLRGRCRHCKKAVSPQYPLVELLTGVLFFLVGLKYLDLSLLWITGGTVEMILQTVLLIMVVSSLIAISLYDIREKEIPNTYNLFFIITSGLLLFVKAWEAGSWNDLLATLAIAAIVFAALWAFVVFTKEKMFGGGDAKLIFGMILFLGAARAFLAFLLGSWAAAIFGLTLITLKKANRKTAVPFGPFLALGTLGALFWGDQIISYYLKLVMG